MKSKTGARSKATQATIMPKKKRRKWSKRTKFNHLLKYKATKGRPLLFCRILLPSYKQDLWRYINNNNFINKLGTPCTIPSRFFICSNKINSSWVIKRESLRIVLKCMLTTLISKISRTRKLEGALFQWSQQVTFQRKRPMILPERKLQTA